MKSDGRSKIMGLLQQHPMTLSEVAKKSELQISTASYHLEKLTDAKIASHDKKSGRYSIDIDKDLMSPILLGLVDKKTVSQLSAHLKKASDKKDYPDLVKMIESKNFESLLNDIIDILYSRGLIVEVHRPLSFGNVKEHATNEFWTLSWQGCTFLKICFHCRKAIDPEGANVVAQTISLHGMGIPYMAPLLHTECAFGPMGEYMFNMVDPLEAESREDRCHYCGLPLSEKVLRNIIQKTDRVSLIHDLLTLSEAKALNIWKKEKLSREFETEHGIALPESKLEDDIIELSEFDIRITEEEYKRLASNSKSKSERRWNYDWSKGPAELKFYASSIASLSFLDEGRRKNCDTLYDLIVEGAQRGNIVLENPELRKKELYSEWRRLIEYEKERVENLIGEVVGDPRSLVYSRLFTIAPGPYDAKSPYSVSEIRGLEHTLSYGYWVKQQDHGFALAKFRDGKVYHLPCFRKAQEDTVQVFGRAGPHKGSRSASIVR